MERYSSRDKAIASLFIIVPIIFVIIGLVFYPFRYPGTETILEETTSIFLFLSLFLLLIGFLIRKEELGNKIKILGWAIFAFFWSTQINTLYFGEEGDFINAFLCVAGIFLLFFIAYQEWISLKTKKQIGCLNWAAGVAAIAGIIYFGIELTPLEMWLREVVAGQSAWLLNIFTGNVHYEGVYIGWEQARVTIIFACTGVQSMVIFVGMILPLKNVNAKKKLYGLLVTVVPVYFLNLVRNALVVYLTGVYGPEFFPTAHNIIGKGGSLVALIILLVIVIKVIPEVFNEIVSLTDLYKRDGPLEQSFRKIWRKK
ncbi:MAG: archaeosortase A [Thermoplasmatales archaeon]|nr:archaeosortase A [Thermoplasmatales archaeon]MCK4996355.1 archaeosortase A [Thermoplasmatales archaeon]